MAATSGIPRALGRAPAFRRDVAAIYPMDMQSDSAVADLANRAGDELGDGEFVWGVSPIMQALQQAVTHLAPTDVPVLIMGEPGSGRTALARFIHQISRRRQAPLTVIHCGLLKGSELPLGGWAGAGEAEANRPAILGTVLLEDIEELPQPAQAKLASGLFAASDGDGAADVRWIASSRKDLESEVRRGRFRGDLYTSMAGVCLRIPPLRHRPEDIVPLTEFFQDKYVAVFGRRKETFSARMQQFLRERTWAGNVRELKDAIRTVLAIDNEAVAMAALRANGSGGSSRNRPVSLKQAARTASRLAEQELILKVLSRTRWNRKRAAAELQISYKALLYKLKQIGLEEPGHPTG